MKKEEREVQIEEGEAAFVFHDLVEKEGKGRKDGRILRRGNAGVALPDLD